MVNIAFCFRLSMFTMCPLHTMVQLLSGLLLAICFGFSSGDRVTQEEKSVIGEENEEVSLKCSFETSNSNADLYWYRQYPGSALQFILYKGSGNKKAEFAKERFDSTVDKSEGTTVLTISKLIPEDSAVYYCAVDGLAIGGDKLTFGTGTSLTVIPKGNNRMPVLSILQTKDLTLSVCLATGFFPRTSPMELTVAKTGEGGEKKQSIPTDNAALSSSKTYFFAGFSKNGEPIETCSLNGTETTTAPQTEEDDPPVTESIVHSPVEDCKPINDTILDSGGSPKVNFMSVVVNCLRILFAKTVTFNMLLTVKAVVF